MVDAPVNPFKTDNVRRRVDFAWRAWLFVFTFFLVVYAMTANRGVQWQDSGSHMLRIITEEMVNPRGLALSHPLHHWLGRAAVWTGLFSPAYAITLVSSIAGALAVANLFGCVWSLTGRGWASLYAACSLGVAHTFWQMATVTETYTLVAALLSAELWVLVVFLERPTRWRLWLIFALGGLGVSNHNLGALTFPIVMVVAIVAVRRRRVTGRDVGIGLIFWLLASSSYTALIVSEVARSGDFTATVSSALFGNAYRHDVLNVSVTAQRMWINVAFVLLNFPGLLVPLAVVGVFRGPDGDAGRVIRRVLVAGLLVHALFAVRYPVVDQHMFFIPTYVYLAIFGGIGMDRVMRSGAKRGHRFARAAFFFLVITPLLYAAAPGIAKRVHVLDGYVRNKPYRDDYVYVFTPWSISDRSAEMMSDRALALAGRRGLIVVEDSMSRPAILFKLHESPDRDVIVVGDLKGDRLAEARAQGRTVVFVPSNTQIPPPAMSKGRWQNRGGLYVYQGDVKTGK